MLKRPQRKANATANPVRMSGVTTISVCWRLSAAREPVSHGNHTWASEKGTPIEWEPTWKNQFRPVPLKIAWYVESGFLCVVTRMTRPAIRNARIAVRSGVTAPPARW